MARQVQAYAADDGTHFGSLQAAVQHDIENLFEGMFEEHGSESHNMMGDKSLSIVAGMMTAQPQWRARVIAALKQLD
jgi:hypothetical protein